MQLENGMTAIGAAGYIGYGFNKTPIYFPKAHTDFIFAVYASNFGFIGSVILLMLIIYFDMEIIHIAERSKNRTNRYIVSGILGILIYQQIQNIGMTFGLLPITGITLPFISYGGSSLLSYMIMIGLILILIMKINNIKIKKRKHCFLFNILLDMELLLFHFHFQPKYQILIL